MAHDRTMLANIRKLVSAHELATVGQGAALIEAVGGEIAQIFAGGVRVTSWGGIEVEDGCEIAVRVRREHQTFVARRVLRTVGRLHESGALSLDIGELPLVEGLTLENLDIEAGGGGSLELLARCTVRGRLRLGCRSRDRIVPVLTDLDALAGVVAREVIVSNAGEEHAAVVPLLARMPNLTKLTLIECALHTIDALALSTTLVDLTLERCAVTTVAALQACPSLRALRVSGMKQLHPASIGELGQLEELRVDLSGDLPWLGRLVRLQKLMLYSNWSAPVQADFSTLSDLRDLDASAPLDVSSVAGLQQLARVNLQRASTGTKVLLRLPALRELHARDCDLEVADVRALLARPTLEGLTARGPQLPQAFDACWGALNQASSGVGWRDLLGWMVPPRSLEAATPLPAAELKAAKRALAAAFKAARSPAESVAAMLAVPLATLRAVGMDARLDERGRVTGETVTAKVTHHADVLLAFADRAGLLDGVGFLDLGDMLYLTGLSALKRHEGTLHVVDTRGVRALDALYGRRSNRSAEELLRALAAAPPLPAAADAASAVATATPTPVPRLPDDIHGLLLGDGASVEAGVRQAAERGLVDTLLAGCSVKDSASNGQPVVTPGPAWDALCSSCGGTGRRGAGSCVTCGGDGKLGEVTAHQRAGVLLALGLLPEGSPTARTVLEGVLGAGTLREPGHGQMAWLRHLPALRALELSWEQAHRHVEILAALPAVVDLRLTGVTGDLAPLARLVQVQKLSLAGNYTLSGLAGHPTLVELRVDGGVRDAEALAEVPTLRKLVVTATTTVEVSALCARLAPRRTVCIGRTRPGQDALSIVVG